VSISARQYKRKRAASSSLLSSLSPRYGLSYEIDPRVTSLGKAGELIDSFCSTVILGDSSASFSPEKLGSGEASVRGTRMGQSIFEGSMSSRKIKDVRSQNRHVRDINTINKVRGRYRIPPFLIFSFLTRLKTR